MRHPRRAFSRPQILNAVWDHATEDLGSNVVNVYVRYPREKIALRGEPSPLKTARGVGYRFDPPGEEANNN